MGILELEDNAAQQSAAEQHAEALLSHAHGTWRRVVHSHQSGMAAMWNNLPEGVTASDVVAAMGTNAVELFELSGKLAEFIGGLDASQVVAVPAGVSYVGNADGSVTITDDR